VLLRRETKEEIIMGNIAVKTLNATSKIILYIILIFFAVIFTFPFYYAFVLATWPTIYSTPPHMFFGSGFFSNLKELFVKLPFFNNFMTSISIATISTAATIFFCTMGGFAFAKYQFKGKKALFAILVSTMAIPPFLNIIPFFKMMVAIGWFKTWLPLIVPTMANAFGIFLMAQFLENSVSNVLLDAARIDGMSEFQILLHIVFPLAKPGIAVLGTVTFLSSWNDFLRALVILPEQQNTTIPVALSALYLRQDGDYGGMMMGTALSILPMFIAFIFFSKKIISNLQAGSVKG
jgi:multiple sugar transport system permease protein